MLGCYGQEGQAEADGKARKASRHTLLERSCWHAICRIDDGVGHSLRH